MVKKNEGLKPLFISERILDIWESDPFFKPGLNTIKQRIKNGLIVVLDNETYNKLNG